MCLLSASFPTKFVHWIMVCITYPRFSISLNGSLVLYFQGGKGLRLGDPLCPYYFVILSRLVHSREGFNNLKFHPHCKELGLTHLSFADDLPMFSAADLPELNLLKDALLDFGKISGLAVYPSKSEVFGASILTTLKQNNLKILQFNEGNLQWDILACSSFVINLVPRIVSLCWIRS